MSRRNRTQVDVLEFDVVPDAFGNPGALNVGDRTLDFGRHTGNEHSGRHHHALWDNCPGSHDATFANDCPIENDGAHPNQAVVANRAAVCNDTMPDDHSLSDTEWELPARHMKHAIVLNVCLPPDTDVVDIPAHRAVEPNADIWAEFDIPNDIRRRRDIHSTG